MAKQKPQTAGLENEENAQKRSPRFTYKKYNAVVQSVELVDIRLTSSKFEVKDEYYRLMRGDRNGNKNAMVLAMGGSLIDFKYVRNEGLMVGGYEWSAGATNGRKQLLSIKSRYLVIYKGAKDLEEPYVGAFLANVGKFASFPYFRAMVAAYGAAASADLPVLPVLRQSIDTAPDEEKPDA